MIDSLTITGIVFKTILMVLFSIGILEFGKLITKTPDMLDRHGERKVKTDAPTRHAKLFIIGFWIIYLIGMGVVLFSGNSRVVIIGWVITFSAILFAGTVLLFEMKIYNLMKKNCRDLKGSLVT